MTLMAASVDLIPDRRQNKRRAHVGPGRRLADAIATARCPSCGAGEGTVEAERAPDGVVEFACRECQDFWLATPAGLSTIDRISVSPALGSVTA